MKAVILVGGEGTRLRPLTHATPKFMVPVLNHPFLEHTIAYLKKCHIGDIILALSNPEVVRNHFGDGNSLGIKLTYSVEDTPLGTAGAVKNAQHLLDSTFVVLNGDVFSDIDLADMLAFHRRQRAKATIALTWVDNPSAFGAVDTAPKGHPQGRVQRFVEKPSPDKVTSHWVNAGVYILEPEVLEHSPAPVKLGPAQRHYMFESGLFPRLLQLGEPVYGYPFSGYWLDMGTPEKYLQVNCDLLTAKAKSPLIGHWSAGGGEVRMEVGTIIHPSAQIAGPALIGSHCHISRGARLHGPVVMGPDCYIGEGAILEKTVLWKEAYIGRGAILQRCIVGSHTTVAEDARIVDGMVAGDQFVLASQ